VSQKKKKFTSKPRRGKQTTKKVPVRGASSSSDLEKNVLFCFNLGPLREKRTQSCALSEGGKEGILSLYAKNDSLSWFQEECNTTTKKTKGRNRGKKRKKSPHPLFRKKSPSFSKKKRKTSHRAHLGRRRERRPGVKREKGRGCLSL